MVRTLIYICLAIQGLMVGFLFSGFMPIVSLIIFAGVLIALQVLYQYERHLDRSKAKSEGYKRAILDIINDNWSYGNVPQNISQYIGEYDEKFLKLVINETQNKLING